MKVANIHLSWSPFTPCHVQVSTRLFGPLKTIGANNPTDHFCLGLWGSVILKGTHVWHKNWNDTGDPRSSLWLQMLGYPWLQTCGLSNHQWKEIRQNRCENRIRLWYPGYSFPSTSSLCPPLSNVFWGSDEEMMCWTSGRFNVKKTLRHICCLVLVPCNVSFSKSPLLIWSTECVWNEIWWFHDTIAVQAVHGRCIFKIKLPIP